MSCPACMFGSLDDGQPRGTDTDLGQNKDIRCYLSKPANPNGAAVIIATDAFGYKLVNARRIADAFADQGFLCAVPHYFKTKPLDFRYLQMSEDLEKLQNRSLFFKVLGHLRVVSTWLAVMPIWLLRNPFAHAVGVVKEVARELRAQYGVTKIAVQGYCYGGKVGVLLAAQQEVVDVVCVAHPAAIKIPRELNAIQVPTQFLCAGSDPFFTRKTVSHTQQVLEAKQAAEGLSLQLHVYPGTQHGFAVRGSQAIPHINKDREDALRRGIQFFKEQMGLVATEGAAAAAAAAVPAEAAAAPASASSSKE